MGTAERRHAILWVLCRRRHDTMQNLASEFGVSVRTIQRDVDVLSTHYPVYTQVGRYMGGVYVLEGYTPDRMYMSEKEIGVLQKLLFFVQTMDLGLTQEERCILQTIILLYTQPTAV